MSQPVPKRNFIGNRIEFIRKEFLVTQQDLANKLEVSWEEVIHWENGFVIPSRNEILKIAKIFDVDIEFFTISDCRIFFQKKNLLKHINHNAYELINQILENNIKIEDLLDNSSVNITFKNASLSKDEKDRIKSLLSIKPACG